MYMEQVKTGRGGGAQHDARLLSSTSIKRLCQEGSSHLLPACPLAWLTSLQTSYCPTLLPADLLVPFYAQEVWELLEARVWESRRQGSHSCQPSAQIKSRVPQTPGFGSLAPVLTRAPPPPPPPSHQHTSQPSLPILSILSLFRPQKQSPDPRLSRGLHEPTCADLCICRILGQVAGKQDTVLGFWFS